MGGTPPQRDQSGKGRKGKLPESPWAQAGAALMIPSILVSGPLAGLLIGWLIRRWTGWGMWVTVIFLFLGMAAGVRETIRVVRRLS